MERGGEGSAPCAKGCRVLWLRTREQLKAHLDRLGASTKPGTCNYNQTTGVNMSEIFMCFVEGSSRPRRIHESLEIATEEARRLSEIPGVGRVFVLADVDVISKPKPKPVVVVKKKKLIQQNDNA